MEKPSTWRLFVWGAKNHPGNLFYVIIVVASFGLAFRNDNPVAGLVAAGAVGVTLAVLYVKTSISVGRANIRLIEKEECE